MASPFPESSLRDAIARLGPFASSWDLHREVEALLRMHGFNVEREVAVENRGDGRPGRVDLVARCGSYSVGIECDRAWPRRKSLAKLRGLDVTYRLVVLRNCARTPRQLGDVAVVAVRVGRLR